MRATVAFLLALLLLPSVAAVPTLDSTCPKGSSAPACVSAGDSGGPAAFHYNWTIQSPRDASSGQSSGYVAASGSSSSPAAQRTLGVNGTWTVDTMPPTLLRGGDPDFDLLVSCCADLDQDGDANRVRAGAGCEPASPPGTREPKAATCRVGVATGAGAAAGAARNVTLPPGDPDFDLLAAVGGPVPTECGAHHEAAHVAQTTGGCGKPGSA